MTIPTIFSHRTACSSCLALEVENTALRAMLRDEQDANIMLQRKIALTAAAQIPAPEKTHVL